jgi:hypothetical protein
MHKSKRITVITAKAAIQTLVGFLDSGSRFSLG